MGKQAETKQDITCKDCGHDIDNHSYKGCHVKKCKCKLKPSDVMTTIKEVDNGKEG